MDEAKIQLSPEELLLVQNAEVLLTKQRIVGRVFDLFGELAAVLQKQMQTVSLADPVKKLSPKIARGENYEGLPYVMLDYPRYFSRENILAIRTFFWWGNFFSVTLQLKGMYLQQYAGSISYHQALLASCGFMIAVAGDEWRHDHSGDQYSTLDTIDEALTRNLKDRDFCKLTARIGLSEWNQSSHRFAKLYEVLTAVLKD